MLRKQWRASLITFVVGFVIVLLALMLTVRGPAPYETAAYVPPELLTPVVLNSANSAAAVGESPFGQLPVGTPMPSSDTLGVSDDQTVPRYPGAVLVGRNDTGMVHEIQYVSADQPLSIVGFYASFAHDKLGMVLHHYRNFGDTAHGYYMAYDNVDQTASVIVFATAQHLDLPPGGVSNPTHIDLMVVGQVEMIGQPTATPLQIFDPRTGLGSR